jgi:USP6 N-terminal-like protein
MGPIAATLLCYFSPSHVYATLSRLHSHPFYALHTVFAPGFPGLLEAIYVQERIIEKMMPDVYRSFQKHLISTTSYATKWYITLFANTVPFQCQMRLWDAFLLDGKDVFIAVAVGIIWAYRGRCWLVTLILYLVLTLCSPKDQITSAEANFETILSLLSSVFVPETEDPFLLWIDKALDDKTLRASMVRWREEWGGLVAAGKASTSLL